MTVQRFNPDALMGIPGMSQHVEGMYVEHDEYARLEQQHAQLRAALVGVLGRVDGREELTELRVIVKHTAPDADTRDVSLAAIDALLATLPVVEDEVES